MLRLLCVGVVIAMTLPAVAADEVDDEKAMQGTWTPTKAELAGAAMPEAVVKSIVLKLTEGKYEATVAGQLDRGTWKLDKAAKPKGLTITGTEGPNKDKTYPCIYELQGDTLRVCYDLSGKKAPTEFATAAGTQLYLVTYARRRSERSVAVVSAANPAGTEPGSAVVRGEPQPPSVSLQPRDFDGADQLGEQVIDLLAFDFGLGGEDDAVAEGGQGDLEHVVGHGVVAAGEGGQRAGGLHQGDAGPRRGPHVELRPLARAADDLVDVIDQPLVDPHLGVRLDRFAGSRAGEVIVVQLGFQPLGRCRAAGCAA